MRKIEDIKKDECALSPSEKEDLQWAVKEIENILKDEKVSERGLTRLDNVVESLLNLKRNYTKRIIKLLKQNHMLD
jgi:hypothetical protein